MSGREEDKHENRTEHNPRIPGASGIQKETNPAQAEEAGLCIGGGAGAGIHRGRVPVRSGVCRSCPAVLLAGWADLRGGENGEKERVRCDYERRTSGKT